MAFGNLENDDNDSVMNEINMIPLVDIMLVLLIVFIITAPVINHAFNLELPQESNHPQEVEHDTIQIAVLIDGSYMWNETPVTESELQLQLSQTAQQEPQPALHINADRNVRYESVIHVMSLAQQATFTKIGFVTSPTD